MTKAQLAVLKYLKKNYPEHYEKFYDQSTGEYALNSRAGTTLRYVMNVEDFHNLVMEHTSFLDTYPNIRPSVRLRTIAHGITDVRYCIACRTEFMIGSEKSFNSDKQFCSIRCSHSSPITKQKKIDTCLGKSGGQYTNISQFQEVKQKKIDTCLRNTEGEYSNPNQDPAVKKKIVNTYLNRSNGKFSHALQFPEVQQKIINTCLEKSEGKYSHPMQFPETKQQFSDTCFDRSDGKYTNPMQDPEIKEKFVNTCLDRSGGKFTNPRQNPVVKQKIRQRTVETYLERSDGKYTHQMQFPEIFNKVQRGSYSRNKVAEFKGKTFTGLMGYEPQALRYLINGEKAYSPKEILHTSEIDYGFPYKKLGKTKTSFYHPDLFIPSENRVVEVKCINTLCRDRTIWVEFKRKRQSVLDAGNKHSLLLMTEKGDRIPVPEHLLDKSLSAIQRYLGKHNL